MYAHSSNKYIFRIAGTSHSGSTMLDLMLSNHEGVFSCGEINALFRPYRPHHFHPACACGDPACAIWESVRSKGEAALWPTMCDRLPGINIFVDSSKDLVWLKDQVKADRRHHNLCVRNILIWKTPEEYAFSCLKRGKKKLWKKSYINYHLRYFSLMKSWVSIRYADLAQNPEKKLASLCHALGISFSPGQSHYWEKRHHTLFGADSARCLLSYNLDNSAGSISPGVAVTDYRQKGAADGRPQIQYKNNIREQLPPEIIAEIDNTPLLTDIRLILEDTETDRTTTEKRMTSRIPRPSGRWYVTGKIRRYLQYLACRLPANKNVHANEPVA